MGPTQARDAFTLPSSKKEHPSRGGGRASIGWGIKGACGQEGCQAYIKAHRLPFPGVSGLCLLAGIAGPRHSTRILRNPPGSHHPASQFTPSHSPTPYPRALFPQALRCYRWCSFVRIGKRLGLPGRGTDLGRPPGFRCLLTLRTQSDCCAFLGCVDFGGGGCDGLLSSTGVRKCCGGWCGVVTLGWMHCVECVFGVVWWVGFGGGRTWGGGLGGSRSFLLLFSFFRLGFCSVVCIGGWVQGVAL